MALLTKYKGFSLIEALVGIAIFAVIAWSLYSLIGMGLKISTEDKAKTGALAIATQKMEIIKNMAYDDIGTVGGVPSGSLTQEETTTLNHITYTINTDVRYRDDPFDGQSPTDTLATDYKKVRIEVSWPSQVDAQPVVLVSNIVPRGIETTEGGGTLWIEVFDTSATAISGATLAIVNNSTSPTINISGRTDADGEYILTGAPVATQSYEITVSKSGYSSGQTYAVDLTNNPNPTPPHATVLEGEVTTQTFTIDYLSSLTINAYDYTTNSPISDFTFTLQGDKTIGTDGEGNPVYKYEEEQTTNSSGQVALTNMEFDTYEIIFDGATTGYDLAAANPTLPLILSPNTTQTLDLYLATHTDHSFWTSVLDTDGNILPDANVRLYNTILGYDTTQITSSFGQTFFSDLIAATYNLEITKTGYVTSTSEIDISGTMSQTISLASEGL